MPQRVPYIRVLGPLTLIDGADNTAHPSAAVAHLLALLVASGRDGLSRELIAAELWPEARPASWKSAVRNRITGARRALGPASIVNVPNGYRLAASVRIDAAGMLDDSNISPPDATQLFYFLRGATLAGVYSSPLVEQYRQRVASARSIRIRSVLSIAPTPLTLETLDALRLYQRGHQLDQSVTEDTVRVHAQAGYSSIALQILQQSQQQASPGSSAQVWLAALTEQVMQDVSQHEPEGGESSPQTIAAAQVVTGTTGDAHHQAFRSAAEAGQWTVAYEIAMQGMPNEAGVSGRGSHVSLLTEIPPHELDAARRSQLAWTLAVQMRIDDPAGALVWSRRGQDWAESVDVRIMADIAAALVGDIADEMALLPLPAALVDNTVETNDLRFCHVAITNYLERVPRSQFAPVMRRFHELIEASDNPFRRWHGMVLETLQSTLDGDWDTANLQATRTRNYGALFGIAEAKFVWHAQMLSFDWTLGTLDSAQPSGTHFLNAGQRKLGEALTVVESGSDLDAAQFLEGFDSASRMVFVVPMLMALAPKVTSPAQQQIIYNRILPRSGSSAVFGPGYIHFGPVDRTLALLAKDAGPKRSHLAAAIALADAQEIRLWQVICRLELAALGPERSLIDEAMDLATTSTLRDIVRSGTDGTSPSSR